MNNTQKAKETITKQFLVKMSIGFDLIIEESELPKAVVIWKSGDVGIFKQGMIKGSFIAGIVEYKDRVIIVKIDDYGHQTRETKQLTNVFKGLDLKQLTDKKLLL